MKAIQKGGGADLNKISLTPSPEKNMTDVLKDFTNKRASPKKSETHPFMLTGINNFNR